MFYEGCPSTSELDFFSIIRLVGWLDGFNVGLELRSGQLPTVCGTHPEGWSGDMPSQFLSSTEGMAPPLWYLQKYNLDGNLEDIAPTNGFYMRQVPLVYMAVFPRRASNPGLRSGAEDSTDRATDPLDF